MRGGVTASNREVTDDFVPSNREVRGSFFPKTWAVGGPETRTEWVSFA